jgi:hypothetical protein
VVEVDVAAAELGFGEADFAAGERGTEVDVASGERGAAEADLAAGELGVAEDGRAAGELGKEQGVHIRVVQEILGHTRVTTTERYTHVATLQMKDASDRMDQALWGEG